MQEAFKAIEPSGKTYRIFADGHTEGFQRGTIISNSIPSLLALAAIQGAERSFQASTESPTKSDVSARGGGSHSSALNVSSGGAKIATAAGEK